MKMVSILIIICMFFVGMLHPAEAQRVEKPKSKRTALYLSLTATIVPCVIGLAIKPTGWVAIPIGLTFGPGAGHFYANQWGRGLKTAGLRLGIGALGVLGVVLVGQPEPENVGAQLVIASIAGAGVVGLVVYDIATAPASVRKYNESIGIIGRLDFMPRLDVRNRNYGLLVCV